MDVVHGEGGGFLGSGVSHSLWLYHFAVRPRLGLKRYTQSFRNHWVLVGGSTTRFLLYTEHNIVLSLTQSTQQATSKLALEQLD